MQTFLPYSSFKKTAEVLDYKRLGKQRVESWQILNAIENRAKGITKGAWLNHPCVLMWQKSEIALIQYSIAICEQWISRGYNDSMLARFEDKLAEYEKSGKPQEIPLFLENEDFHRSHRSNLLKKDFSFYSKHFNDPTDLPYLWILPR
jgi:hypothetical protein